MDEDELAPEERATLQQIREKKKKIVAGASRCWGSCFFCLCSVRLAASSPDPREEEGEGCGGCVLKCWASVCTQFGLIVSRSGCVL